MNLASGAEICAYHHRVLQEHLLPGGRVTWLPLHDVDEDGTAVSLVNGRRQRLVARRRWVDATQADTQVPATRLEAYTGLFERLQEEANPALEALQARLRKARGPGYGRMAELLPDAGAQQGRYRPGAFALP